MNRNRELGTQGEALAAQFLIGRGFALIAQNWRCASGEIDLIMHEGNELVFVEVKTRRSMAYGDPLEAVDAEKLARLHRLAAEWMREHHIRARYRIDVLGIILAAATEPQIEHIRGVGL